MASLAGEQTRCAILARMLQEEASLFDQLGEVLSRCKESYVAPEANSRADLLPFRQEMESILAAIAKNRREIQNHWAPLLGIPWQKVQIGLIREILTDPEKTEIQPALEKARFSSRKALDGLARLESLVHSGLSLLEELIGVLTGTRTPPLYGRDGHLQEGVKGSVFEMRG